MKKYKFNILYKTTNIINNKYYIGVHSTNNLDDGYLGSGKILKRSVNKYGKENHIREILSYCKTPKESFKLESKIITQKLINEKLCINLALGGDGGNLGDEINKKISNSLKGRFIGDKNPFYGKTHSEETIIKIKEKRKLQKSSNKQKEAVSKNTRRRAISDKNWKLLLKDFDKISNPIWGKTYKELSEKYNIKIQFVKQNFYKYKNGG